MEALKIEILNPKALKLIRDMEDLNLIKVSSDPISKMKAYLMRMRKDSDSAPSIEEIAKMVDEVRTSRNEEK
tara:strand:+ start:2068 stop:2283 length:216 start_codon:yes stop_codon:yes gene_type:complete